MIQGDHLCPDVCLGTGGGASLTPDGAGRLTPGGPSSVDGRNAFAAPKKPWLKPMVVGIYRGTIIPGLLRWCEMDSVHPQGGGGGGKTVRSKRSFRLCIDAGRGISRAADKDSEGDHGGRARFEHPPSKLFAPGEGGVTCWNSNMLFSSSLFIGKTGDMELGIRSVGFPTVHKHHRLLLAAESWVWLKNGLPW